MSLLIVPQFKSQHQIIGGTYRRVRGQTALGSQTIAALKGGYLHLSLRLDKPQRTGLSWSFNNCLCAFISVKTFCKPCNKNSNEDDK